MKKLLVAFSFLLVTLVNAVPPFLGCCNPKGGEQEALLAEGFPVPHENQQKNEQSTPTKKNQVKFTPTKQEPLKFNGRPANVRPHR